MTLNREQIETLTRGIHPDRVRRRAQAGMSTSYLTQADVRTYAIRIFGFGGFDVEAKAVETLYQGQVAKREGEGQNWYCVVRALVQVRIHALDATYAEYAVGGSTQPVYHEAMDMATKTAVSDAMKRCFVNLGDQFGLSLYFNGSVTPAVRSTLVDGGERGPASPSEDVIATPAAGGEMEGSDYA